MATFLDLCTRVRTRLIDLPTAVTNEVPSLVNEAMREIQQDHDFKVMEFAITDVVTVAGTHTLTAIPPDFKKLRERPYRTDESGVTWRMRVSPNIQDMLSRFDTLGEGPPEVLLDPATVNILGDRNLEVWPLPDGNSDYGDGEYRITIPYWQYHLDLTADGDVNWFTNNAALFIIAQATANGFFLDWDEDRASVWVQIAANEKQRAIKADKLYRLGAFDTWVPYKGARDRRVG